MSGFQFIHVATYGRYSPKKNAKGKERKWTVRDIAGEAERKPEHSPHVEKPQEPKLLFGMMPSEAVAEAERRAAQSKDITGRKIRKDAHVLLAGVTSHPATVDQLSDPVTKRSYEEWKRDTLEWFKRKYGDNLLSVVEHLDEPHPHLHFYAVPKAGPGFNAKSLHDGFSAAHGAKNPVEQKKLYCDGMRALQDDFFKSVGAKHAQARHGPRRRRLTRAQWLQEQQQLAQLSKLMRAGKLTLAKAQKQAGLIIERAKGNSQKLGVKFGAFFGGAAGRARDALRRAERERDAERLKLKKEREQRVKTEKQLEETRQMLVHERLTSDQRVANLVALKTLPLQKQLEVEVRKRAELALKSNFSAGDNQQQKSQQQRQGPKLGT